MRILYTVGSSSNSDSSVNRFSFSLFEDESIWIIAASVMVRFPVALVLAVKPQSGNK